MSTKIIFYPRDYNKRGDASLHSVTGVTSDGEEINVKLRIDEEFASGKRAPSISELSRVDRKARSPAMASKNNCAENHEGVILFSQVIFEKRDRSRNINSYIAGWATVLCEDSDSPHPIIGLGRIKVKKDSIALNALKNKLKTNLTPEERERVINAIDDPKNFDYSTILYRPDLQIEINNVSNAVEAMDKSRSFFDELHKDNISFGFYIVSCDEDGNPIPNTSYEKISKYNSVLSEVTPPQEFLANLKDTIESTIAKDGGVILTPCYKLNASNGAKNYYANKDAMKMIKRAFHSDDGYARVNSIAVKIISIAGGKGTIFDKTHPLDYERLNLDLIDTTGTENRLYSSKMRIKLNDKEIHPIRIGSISRAELNNFCKQATLDYSGQDCRKNDTQIAAKDEEAIHGEITESQHEDALNKSNTPNSADSDSYEKMDANGIEAPTTEPKKDAIYKDPTHIKNNQPLELDNEKTDLRTNSGPDVLPDVDNGMPRSSDPKDLAPPPCARPEKRNEESSNLSRLKKKTGQKHSTGVAAFLNRKK